jgi:hypothetical protein
MPENMPDRMSKQMLNRMPEGMSIYARSLSDRMSE